VGKAVSLLNAAGIPVIVVTDQTVAGRNEITNDELDVINHTILSRLRRHGAYYDALYDCPHAPTVSSGCFCRKPAPGLLFRAALDRKVDLMSSFMVGDKLNDIQAGKAAGCKTVLISPESSRAYQAGFVAPNLLDSVFTMLKYS
jgi:D-glycero-D-manno-heptose 1,7-bisphosphate phosphatase